MAELAPIVSEPIRKNLGLIGVINAGASCPTLTWQREGWKCIHNEYCVFWIILLVLDDWCVTPVLLINMIYNFMMVLTRFDDG